MTRREMRARLIAAVEAGVKQFFLQAELNNEELRVGEITLNRGGTATVRAVDKRYQTYVWKIVTVEEKV